MPVDVEFLRVFDQLMAQDDRSDAIAFVQSKIKDSPRSVVYWEHLGIAYWVSGDSLSAFRTFEDARMLGELSDIGELIFIHTQIAFGRRRTAKKVLSSFLLERCISREHLEKLASKFGKLGEFSLALLVCQHLVDRYPHNADAWYGIGFYQERIGVAPAMLVKPFQTAVALSQAICAKMHLAKVLFELDRLEESYEIVKQIPVAHLKRCWWARTASQVAKRVGDQVLEAEIELQSELNRQGDDL